MGTTSLPRFFLLTFALTWTLWIAAGVLSGGLLTAGKAQPRPGLFAVLILPGVFAPAAVALWLTGRADGRIAVQALLRRLFQWRVGLRWYVFAAGYMAAIKLSVAILHRVATGSWPRVNLGDWYLMLAATAFSTVIGGQAGEEIGWRGYALPRLAVRFGLGGGSVLLGVIWVLWHLPLFFIPGADLTGQSLPVYLLAGTALSVAMAWLYSRTKGSLLLVMLMHAAINNTTGIVPGAQLYQPVSNPFSVGGSLVTWLTVLLLWIAATYFLVRMGRARGEAASGVADC